MKRSRTQAQLAYPEKFSAAKKRKANGAKRQSGTTQQAIRTGGWADPSRMQPGGELKFVDTIIAFQTLGGSSAFVDPPSLLNGLVPGSAATQRIGRKVVMKSIYIRWVAEVEPTTVAGANIRWIVFYDKQANATAATPDSVLESDAFTSPNDLSNRDRFVVIWDKVTNSVSQEGNISDAGKEYKSISLETCFNSGTAGTISDITSGSLYIMAAQSGSATTLGPQFKATVRVRYTD